MGVTDWGCGHNDTDYRWIGKRDWLFRRTLPPIPPGRWHKVILELQVDTVATVSIDNISVGRTENQFVRYRFDITKVCCQLAENQRRPTLSILVHSASETARRLHDSYPYDVPDDFVPELQGEPHRNFIRKQQCSFGWDWGPCFLNSAVLHAQLLCFAERSVKIDGMVPIISRHSNGVDWLIMVDYWLLRNGDQSENSLTVSAVVKASDGQVMAECSQPSGTEQKSLELCVKQPELWWPNGHGDQPLYQLCLSIADRTNSQAVLDSAAVSIAFRQVELVQQLDADHQGSCFRFAVNGKPIFAKGANFIPVDAFNTRVTRERLELLLRQGLDANMNMVSSATSPPIKGILIGKISFEFGAVVYINRQNFMTFAIGTGCWYGRNLCLPVPCILRISYSWNQFVRKSNSKSSDWRTIPAFAYGRVTMKMRRLW